MKWREQHMDVIRHDCPGMQRVASVVEVKEGGLDDSGNLGSTQVASTMRRVESGFDAPPALVPGPFLRMTGRQCPSLQPLPRKTVGEPERYELRRYPCLPMRKISSIVDKTPRASLLHRQPWPPAHLSRIRPPREARASRPLPVLSHHRVSFSPPPSEIGDRLDLHSGRQADALQLGVRGHLLKKGIAGETPALPEGETPALRKRTKPLRFANGRDDYARSIIPADLEIDLAR